MNEKEFYKIMGETRKRIESLDLPEEEKDKLYLEIDRRIEGFWENKQNNFSCQKTIKDFRNNLKELLEIYKENYLEVVKTSTCLDQNQKELTDLLNKCKSNTKEIEETTKNLQRGKILFLPEEYYKNN